MVFFFKIPSYILYSHNVVGLARGDTLSRLKTSDFVGDIRRARLVLVNWPESIKAFDAAGNLLANVNGWPAADQEAFILRALHPDKQQRLHLLPYEEGKGTPPTHLRLFD